MHGFMAMQGFNLNTSHVVVYPGHTAARGERGYNLNTSHVVVYLYAEDGSNVAAVDLNTSHVVVYHTRRGASRHCKILFKYISCCSLSLCKSFDFKQNHEI